MELSTIWPPAPPEIAPTAIFVEVTELSASCGVSILRPVTLRLYGSPVVPLPLIVIVALPLTMVSEPSAPPRLVRI